MPIPSAPRSSSRRSVVFAPPKPGGSMTEVRELDVINEALAIIDRALSEMTSRSLVSSDEMSDLLLDVRSLLTTNPAG
jgi:hypothetical protein